MQRRWEVRRRLPLLLLLLTLARAQLVPNSDAEEDPCLPGRHQVISGQVERSFNYRLPAGDTPLCDRLLALGWYRFDSAAGTNMPTACPGAGFCGTQSPIWLKGSIPHPADGTVSRTACINQGKDCCVGTIPVLVRNCSSYSVYQLPPSPGCSLAYCAGHEVACPAGLTSRTGFTPCYFTNTVSAVTVRQTADALQEEILFLCDVTLEDRTHPSAFVLELTWLVDGRVVDTEEISAGQRRAGLLRESQWSMGQTISCRARVRHELVAKYGPPVTSDPFFAGIKILSESPLRLKEGSSARFIQLVSTVPVLCPRGERVAECCVFLELGMRSTGPAQRCANGDIVDRVGLPNCLQRICADNWNQTRSVPVRARLDHLLDGDQTMTVDMRTQFTVHRQWANYRLPPQTVEVIGDDVFEVCVVDMFMYTFDSFAYQHKLNGTFVLYKHDALGYEVQVRFGPCTRRELCVCSVSVRLGDVMVAADICSLGFLKTWTGGRDGARPATVPAGLQLQQLNDGRSYQVFLPSGTSIVLGPYLGYVKVYGSPSDLRLTRGLCGTFDRDQSNDLSRPDGSLACRVPPYTRCDDFSESWRVPDERSLFVGVFDQTSPVLPTGGDQPYCTCQYTEAAVQAAGAETERPATSGLLPAGAGRSASIAAGQLAASGEVVCTSSSCQDDRAKNFADTLFDDNKDIGLYSAPPALAAPPAVPVLYQPLGGFDTPAPPGGWSRQTALRFCRSYLQSTPVAALCGSVRGVTTDDKLAECAADILYTGSTMWAVATLDSFKEDCRTEIYRNTSLWVQQGTDQFPSPPNTISSLLCLNDCSARGRCDKGLCVCQRGFVGSDCSIDLNTGPRVTSLQNDGLCDVTTRPCRQVVIQGENFADHPDLVCHFEIYNLDGTLSSPASVVQTNASFLSFQQLVCALPDLIIHDPAQPLTRNDRGDASRAVMEVSVCYGTGPRSRPQQLLVYDGRCWSCAAGGSCVTRPLSPCFQPGQLLPVVPVLRFHFNFSGVNVIVGGRHPVCSLPRDPGPCLSTERRYYFDFAAGTCKAFNYGGCLGNSNNFRTLGQCGARCEKLQTSTERSDQDLKPPLCFLPPNSGPCQKVLTRYFFDPASGSCDEFSYGGCFGNANNFENAEECKTVCGAGTAVIPASLAPTPVSTADTDTGACLLPATEGIKCLFRPETRYAFNLARKRCEPYQYLGCGGNRNTFGSAADCEALCLSRAARRPGIPLALACSLPAARGGCVGSERAFFWDASARRCRPFVFSGCGGNANNFPTAALCQAACDDGATTGRRLAKLTLATTTEPTEHTADRPLRPEGATEASAGRTTEASAGRTTEASAGRTTERAETSSGRTTKRTETSSGRTTKRTETSSGRTAERTRTSSGRTAERTETSSGRTAERTETSAGRTAERTRTLVGRTTEGTETPGRLTETLRPREVVTKDGDVFRPGITTEAVEIFDPVTGEVETFGPLTGVSTRAALTASSQATSENRLREDETLPQTKDAGPKLPPTEGTTDNQLVRSILVSASTPRPRRARRPPAGRGSVTPPPGVRRRRVSPAPRVTARRVRPRRPGLAGTTAEPGPRPADQRAPPSPQPTTVTRRARPSRRPTQAAQRAAPSPPPARLAQRAPPSPHPATAPRALPSPRPIPTETLPPPPTHERAPLKRAPVSVPRQIQELLQTPLVEVPAPDLTSAAPAAGGRDLPEHVLRSRLAHSCLHPALETSADDCPARTERLERFFYDQQTGRCETFLYGGCGATLNHFVTRSDCERTCRPLNMCFQPMPPRGATCEDGVTVTKYFFNAEASVCEPVNFEQCEEMPNSFSDIESCILTCEAPSFLSIRL